MGLDEIPQVDSFAKQGIEVLLHLVASQEELQSAASIRDVGKGHLAHDPHTDYTSRYGDLGSWAVALLCFLVGPNGFCGRMRAMDAMGVGGHPGLFEKGQFGRPLLFQFIEFHYLLLITSVCCWWGDDDG